MRNTRSITMLAVAVLLAFGAVLVAARWINAQAAGTTTRTRLIATASRPATRAEVLWGEGVQVTDVDVATALGRAGA